jgi:hypothetical protein
MFHRYVACVGYGLPILLNGGIPGIVFKAEKVRKDI